MRPFSRGRRGRTSYPYPRRGERLRHLNNQLVIDKSLPGISRIHASGRGRTVHPSNPYPSSLGRGPR